MRPAFVPTDDQRRMVESMAGFGIPQPDIARVLKIDGKTLRKYFRYELDTGTVKANTAVGQNLFRIASMRPTNANGRFVVSAAIFWMKARAGWSERTGAPADQHDPEQFARDTKKALDKMDGTIGGARSKDDG